MLWQAGSRSRAFCFQNKRLRQSLLQTLHQDPRPFGASVRAPSKAAPKELERERGQSLRGHTGSDRFPQISLCPQRGHPANPVLSPTRGSVMLGFVLGSPRALHSTPKATSSAPQNPLVFFFASPPPPQPEGLSPTQPGHQNPPALPPRLRVASDASDSPYH